MLEAFGIFIVLADMVRALFCSAVRIPDDRIPPSKVVVRV
jgi:hypothetical protein